MSVRLPNINKEHETQRVIHVLRTTELTVGEIAKRFSITRQAVLKINRLYQVRRYDDARQRWTVA